MKEKRFKIGDAVTLKDKSSVPGGKYIKGNPVCLITSYSSYMDDLDCYWVSVNFPPTGDVWGAPENYFIEYDQPPAAVHKIDFKNTKISVENEAISEAVQKLMFANGCKWNNTETGSKNIHANFLYVDLNLEIRYGLSKEHFNDKGFKEIQASAILSEPLTYPDINFSNTKIHVPNSEISKAVQSVLFKRGYKWNFSSDLCQSLANLSHPYLYIESDKSISSGTVPAWFQSSSKREIPYSHILGPAIQLTKDEWFDSPYAMGEAIHNSILGESSAGISRIFTDPYSITISASESSWGILKQTGMPEHQSPLIITRKRRKSQLIIL